MRRLLTAILTLSTAATLAACSAGGAPGWTYAPAPSTTPAASGGASGEPSAGASGGASAAPSTGTSAAPSSGNGSPAASQGAGGPGGSITIAAPSGAATAGFEPNAADGTANTQFELIFDNQDPTAPHNLILQNPDGSNVQVQGDTAFFTGPGQRQYTVPPLGPGAYKYICQVHPTTMVGTLTLK